MPDRQPHNMVELDLTDHVVVVTDNGEQHMTIKEMSELVSRGDNVDKLQVKVDLNCQG